MISSDGCRDINYLIKNKQDFNIYSSTFCSADIVYKLLNELEDTILIIDEFHNLSYNNVSDKTDNIYKIITSDKIKKKLFMSATPKIYQVIDENDVLEHSVNNYEDLFGKIYYSYDFEKAIEHNYVNNYQIIVPNNEIEKNKYEFIYSSMLYYGYKKCLIYCKNIDDAKLFVEEIEKINDAKYKLKMYTNLITYKTPFEKRNKIMNEFIDEKYKLSFIISVHTMDECIDIPLCDSVYLTYTVTNPINIVQRISRCLRTYKNKQKSGIFLWCLKYVQLKNIGTTIKNIDSNYNNKIIIKKFQNEKKDNVEKINDIVGEIENSVKINKEDLEKIIDNKIKSLLSNYPIQNINDLLLLKDDTDIKQKNNKYATFEEYINSLDKNNYKVSKDFIIKYYELTKDNFVSISDCIDWLQVTRDNILKTLKKTYKINTDFFEINYKEEDNITKFGKHIINIKSSTKTFYKLTTDCFKSISISSNSEVGKLTKVHLAEMEQIIENYKIKILKN